MGRNTRVARSVGVPGGALAVELGEGGHVPIMPSVMQGLEPTLAQGWLRRFLVTFDFPKGRLVLEPTRARGEIPASSKELFVIPFTLPSPDVIMVQARINGVEAQYHVDTGYSWTWMDPAFAKQAGLTLESEAVNRERGVSYPAQVGHAQVATAQIGSVNVSPYLRSVFVMPSTDSHRAAGLHHWCFGDLGLTFLRKFAVTIDHVNLVLWLKPHKSPPPRSVVRA